MSSDPSLKLLLDAANLEQQSEGNVILKELNRLSMTNRWEPSPCMMQDVGNYLTITTNLLSDLAKKVINGEDIDTYAKSRVQEARVYNDLSELDPVHYLHEKHAALK
jgi:hypothetical protein